MTRQAPEPSRNAHPSEETFFTQAVELSPSKRQAFLRRVAAEDRWLGQRLEALLQAHANASNLLVSPVRAAVWRM